MTSETDREGNRNVEIVRRLLAAWGYRVHVFGQITTYYRGRPRRVNLDLFDVWDVEGAALYPHVVPSRAWVQVTDESHAAARRTKVEANGPWWPDENNAYVVAAVNRERDRVTFYVAAPGEVLSFVEWAKIGPLSIAAWFGTPSPFKEPPLGGSLPPKPPPVYP